MKFWRHIINDYRNIRGFAFIHAFKRINNFNDVFIKGNIMNKLYMLLNDSKTIYKLINRTKIWDINRLKQIKNLIITMS